MSWSNFTAGARDLFQMVLIPAGGLVLALILGAVLLAGGRPDPWLAGVAMAMMGLPIGRRLDLRRSDDKQPPK